MAKQPQLTPTSLALPEQHNGSVASAFRGVISAVRVAPLRWAVGLFCAGVGALMLVVPHQFGSASFAFIRPFLFSVGIIYLLAGASLLVATVTGTNRWSLLVGHIACAAVLAFYAYALLRTATLAAAPLYLTLSLGTLAAGFITPRQSALSPAERRDLFAFLMGVCAVSLGGVLLVAPEQFRSPIYDPIRAHLRLFGLVYVLGGGALILVHVRPPSSRLLFWLPHALIGGTFLYYMSQVSIPNRGITGILFYAGFGSLLLVLPIVGPLIARFDGSLLRVRLSLIFVLAAALPLTVAVALLAAQQERIAVDQALLSRRLLAASIAAWVEDYIDLHRSAIVELAADPAFLEDEREQLAALTRFNATYPQFFACSRFDAAGQGLVRSDGRPPTRAPDPAIFEQLRANPAPAVQLSHSRSLNRPVIAFLAPIAGADGVFAGAITCALESDRFAALLEEVTVVGGRQVYILDEAGRAVVSSDPAVPVATDLSASFPVAAALRTQPVGAQVYRDGRGEFLAGYALMPEFRWGVVVERALRVDLRDVYNARELAFLILLLGIGAAAGVGIVVARYLTGPLDALAVAVSRFGAGDAAAPLPEEGISEVDRVSAAVDRMRRDLTAAAAGREQAIAQRDTFFSVAAHELKTPLTALLGQAQLVQRRAEREGELSEKNRRSLSVVVAQAQRLDTLITDLLDISRLHQGRLSLQVAPLDLGALVAQVVEETRPTAEDHAIRCEILGDGEPIMVDGDVLRLEQVLHNLISNAVKYSPAGGDVLIRVERLGEEAQISVCDNGIGIPADAMPRLFERFYRAPNADPRQISGMGVGLFVVREIVTLHGGRVEARSVEGRGSIFTVVLPALPA